MVAESYEIEQLNTENGGGVKDASQIEPPAERRLRLLKQVGLASLVSLGTFCLGSTLTWPSPALSNMIINNQTLLGVEISLTANEKDMSGSLLYLGTLFGAWLAGWTVAAFGRHRSMQISTVPYLVGWLMVGLCHNAAVLLTGRFILGLATGITCISSLSYVVELSDTKIRGKIGNLLGVGIVSGSLFTVLIGYFLQWHHLSLVCIVPVVLYLPLSFLLPESPSYLIVKGYKQRAVVILKSLRGNYADVAGEVAELERLNASGRSNGWRELLKKAVIKRMLVMIMLFYFMHFCGSTIMMVQTSRMLRLAGTSMDPDAITVIAGVFKVGGVISAFFLLDRIGRKYCYVISHAINATAMIILGAYVHLEDNGGIEKNAAESLSWVPTVCVVVAVFTCDVGVRQVPFILAFEYFPTSIRSQAGSICISAGTGLSFVSLQLYSPMRDTMTQAGLYWFYGATSIVAIVFTMVAVVETKGKVVG